MHEPIKIDQFSVKPDFTSPAALPGPQPNWALFLDFDGTLVDFAPSPGAIEVHGDVPDIVTRLNQGLNGALAIISGRRIAEIDQHLGIRLENISGLHGFEYRHQGDPLADASLPDGVAERLDHCREQLQAFTAAHPGTLFEDKGQSVALHFRRRPEARNRCLLAVEGLLAEARGTLMLLRGNMVFELKPAGIDKGQAVHRFMAMPPFQGRMPVFVGDDVTDEYGFAAATERGGYGIVVGAREPTAARARLSDVADMITWLREGSERLLEASIAEKKGRVHARNKP